jgi:hypothetical protein
MAKLTAKARKAIPTKDFALGKGRYPIEDASHARNALARVAQHGTPAQKATVRAKVHEKYPGIGEGGKKAMAKKKDEPKREGRGGEMKKSRGEHGSHDPFSSQKGTMMKAGSEKKRRK